MMREYRVNKIIEGAFHFMLVDGNGIVETGILAEDSELLADGENPFLSYNKVSRQEYLAEYAEGIRRSINEACVPLFGFTAYLIYKVKGYEMEWDCVKFGDGVEAESLYKNYTEQIPINFANKLGYPQPDKIKQLWCGFYRQALQDEQRNQQNKEYKKYFGESLEVYRKGYIDWLEKRIENPLPPSQDYDKEEWLVCIVKADDIPVFVDSMRGKSVQYIGNVVKQWVKSGRIRSGSEKGKMYKLLHKHGLITCKESWWNKNV